jgi:hypothetical protein
VEVLISVAGYILLMSVKYFVKCLRVFSKTAMEKAASSYTGTRSIFEIPWHFPHFMPEDLFHS